VDETLTQLLKAVLAVVLPVLVGLIYKWLGIQQNTQAAGAVNLAAERAAGVSYAQAVDGNGVGYANEDAYTRVAEAASRLGISRNQFDQMVKGERGKLLASDPNTSIPTGG